VFIGDFGYPFGYPYWYDGFYPYGYGYGYNNYDPAVYQDAAAYDGALVGQVQTRLTRAGLYRGAIDGVMGPQTRRAIRAYQRSNGLRADGTISNSLITTMGLG
jgi:murein L,D-transpeptidase YcbB/YkuD